MPRSRWLVVVVAAVTFGSGVLNLYSVMGRSLPQRQSLLREFFPLEFLHLARSVTLLAGFALIISSINVYRRKRRAFVSVAALSAGSIVFHLTKGIDYEAAAFSLAVLALLWWSRGEFVVKSELPEWRPAAVRLGAALLVALGYGVAGFWFLEPREFGINFTLADSIHRTFHYLTLAGDPELVPHTRFAAWFLDSLYLITITAVGYSGFVLFRPVVYRFRTYPHECALAKGLVETYGRSAVDFFKTWPDKSLFFLPGHRSFLAYRVGANFAVVLGDPVGPEELIEETVRAFREVCRENDWGLAFYQTLPDFLPVYRRLGFKRMKVGDEAVVDLPAFRVEGRKGKEIRNKLTQFEKLGIVARRYEPPVADGVLVQLKEVSDEWLQLPGRRERQFTLGKFEMEYVRATPVFTAEDGQGRVLGFLNIIPSYRKGETAIDLMRRRTNAPNGVMDFLFYRIFLRCKEEGMERFNLGLAPMAGFQEKEEASIEERAVHAFFQQLNSVFSYRGLRSYKAKFASIWEPRYVIYRNVLDLPRLAVALGRVSEIKG